MNQGNRDQHENQNQAQPYSEQQNMPQSGMNSGYGYQQSADDEIDLAELFGVIWKGKLLIIICTFVFALGSVAYALSLADVYKSDALLAPVSADGGGMGGLASKFGGLASLAGVSLPSGGADKTTIGLEVLKSRKFVSEFIQNHGLAVDLMAAKGWDRSSNELIIDPEMYDISAKAWTYTNRNGLVGEPSAHLQYKAFLDNLSAAQDKESGFVTLSFEHFSPVVAQKIVKQLVDDINETIRLRDVAQAKRSIDYLRKELESNQLAELQTGLFELIQSQTETIMLANASPEYLFQIVDPALVAEEKFKPKRALICVLGTMLGGMLGVFIVLIRGFRNKAKADTE